MIQSPNVKVLDEKVSAFYPQVMKTRNIPHLSYILRNPEPLETELKICVASVLGK